MTKKRIVLAIAVLVSSGAAWYALNSLYGAREVPRGIPPVVESHNVKVELRPESSDEFWRKRIYSDDGTRLVETEVAYRDGGRGYMYYRSDGTLREEVHKYGNGGPRRRVNYATNGVTVLMSESFRADGTREHVFQLNPDGLSEETRFYEDGTTVKLHRLTDRNGAVRLEETFRADGTREFRRLVLANNNREETSWHRDGTTISHRKILDRWSSRVELEEEFRDDGTPIRRMERLANGNTDTRTYYPNGNLFIHELRTSYWDTTTTYYQEDGVTVRKKFAVGYSTAKAWFHADNGALAHYRYFYNTGMDVEVYRADGTVSYKQTWRYVAPPVYGQTGSYWLQSVDVLDDQGQLVRRQFFNQDGTLRESRSYESGQLTSVRHFRADGTVAKEEVYEDGVLSRTDEYEPDDDVREHVDPLHRRQLDYEDPR